MTKASRRKICPFGIELIVNGKGCIVSELENERILEILRREHLLVVRGCNPLHHRPEVLQEIASLIGTPIDNKSNGIPDRFLHPRTSKIFVHSNLPPSNRRPPPRREVESSLLEGGYQYPNQTGWHHDQSFVSDPPQFTLLYGHTPTQIGGETLYAHTPHEEVGALISCCYDDTLTVVHTVSGFGRTESEVKDCKPVKQGNTAHHSLCLYDSFSGADFVFLCDGCQIDFVDGPFLELEKGVNGQGARVLAELLRQLTAPSKVYLHKWEPNDLVIHNNFSVLHSATWYDGGECNRVLWRVTI